MKMHRPPMLLEILVRLGNQNALAKKHIREIRKEREDRASQMQVTADMMYSPQSAMGGDD